MSEINYLAVAVAALLSFALGGLWYSPLMFLKAWTEDAKIDPKTVSQVRHPAFVYGFAYVLSFIAALFLSHILGPNPSLAFAVQESLLIGLAFVATTFGINYLFSGYSVRHWLINAGYHVVQFIIFGLVLGLWH